MSRLDMLEDAKSIGATGILIAIAIFAAYKAGQVSGLKEKMHSQQVLDLEILKQKWESALGRLLEETPDNVQLPEGRSLSNIIE
jgi:hypothetical protein